MRNAKLLKDRIKRELVKVVVTRKDIMNYHLLGLAIEKSSKKLERYKKNEPCVSVGKVKGSYPVFPFIECGFTVGGAIQEEYVRWKEWDEKCRYLEIQIKQDIARMTELKSAIDVLIAGITDIQDKMIFEYTMDGKSQQWIAAKVGLDQSVVSRRIQKYVA